MKGKRGEGKRVVMSVEMLEDLEGQEGKGGQRVGGEGGEGGEVEEGVMEEDVAQEADWEARAQSSCTLYCRRGLDLREGTIVPHGTMSVLFYNRRTCRRSGGTVAGVEAAARAAAVA